MQAQLSDDELAAAKKLCDEYRMTNKLMTIREYTTKVAPTTTSTINVQRPRYYCHFTWCKKHTEGYIAVDALETHFLKFHELSVTEAREKTQAAVREGTGRAAQAKLQLIREIKPAASSMSQDVTM